MSEIAEVREALRTTEAGELKITQTCEADAPIILPSRPFRFVGDGVGSTIVRVPHGDALLCSRAPVGGPTVIENLTIQTSGADGDAIRIVNRGPADHSQRLHVKNVTIEPEFPFAGGFRHGVVLDDVWNFLIDNVQITGNYADVTPAQLEHATMEAAIDLREGQEGRIERVRLTCATYGIRGRATRQGTGEGLHIAPQYLLNVLRGIDLEGGLFGGTRTPRVTIKDCHVFFSDVAVEVRNYSRVLIENVDANISHFVERYTGPGTDAPYWPIAFVLKDCHDFKVIHANAFKTGPDSLGYGIAALGCDVGRVHGCSVEPSVMLSLWLHNCRDVRYGGNHFRAQAWAPGSGVIDQFGQNNSDRLAS